MQVHDGKDDDLRCVDAIQQCIGEMPEQFAPQVGMNDGTGFRVIPDCVEP